MTLHFPKEHLIVDLFIWATCNIRQVVSETDQKWRSPNYGLVKGTCLLITGPKGFPASDYFLCLLHLFTLHIVLLKYIFFKLFSLISHASSLLLSFLVVRSRYLTLCLHFYSVLLLLIHLLLNCSLSLSLACMVGMQPYIFVCLCVGASECVFASLNI